MDGCIVNRVATIGDVIESGMEEELDFNDIRLRVTNLLKKNGCYALGIDRIVGKTVTITVCYWDESGHKQSEPFDEWPSYTKIRPVNTW